MNIQPTDLRITGNGDVTYRGAPTIRIGKLIVNGLKVTATCVNASCPLTTPEPRASTAEAIRDLVAHLNGSAPGEVHGTSLKPIVKPAVAVASAPPIVPSPPKRGRQTRISVPQIFPTPRA